MHHPHHDSPPAWDGRSKGSPVGIRVFMFLIRHTGLVPAYALLFFVAWWYALVPRDATPCIRDFRRRLGLSTNTPDLFRHYYGFGMSLVDRFVFLSGRKTSLRYTGAGEELIAQAVARGTGVILLSAHVGNYELAGNLLHDRIQATINIVALDNEAEQMRRVYSPLLSNRRLKLITVTADQVDVTVQILRALRQGEIVCFHGDRVLDQRSELLPFLGHPARFPIGPYAVAAIARCPIIPFFVVKNGLRTYAMTAYDPIDIPECSREERPAALRAAACRFANVLETIVRAHPREWHNYYPFWGE